MIKVEGLTKRYARHVAVDNISFEVGKGEIVGFLGPNGAGKTTTMRVLTCFLPPTSGTANVAGFDVLEQSLEVKKRIGYLPETPPLYPEMEVAEYLTFVAQAQRHPCGRHRQARGRGLRALRPRRCQGEADRQAVQRLPPARRHRAGHHPQSRRPDPRRAHLRPRPQADHRNPRADCQPCRAITPSFSAPTSCRKWSTPAAGHHHQPGQTGGHRFGGEPHNRCAATETVAARRSAARRAGRRAAAPGTGVRRSRVRARGIPATAGRLRSRESARPLDSAELARAVVQSGWNLNELRAVGESAGRHLPATDQVRESARIPSRPRGRQPQ